MGLLGAIEDVGKGIGHAVSDGAKDVGDAAKSFGGAVKDVAGDVGKAVSSMSPSQIGHTVLDGVGMVPVVGSVADLANAGWYAAEGDLGNAALSAAGAIPIAGDAALGAKWVKNGVHAAEGIADAAKAGKDARAIAHVGEDAVAATKDVRNATRAETGAAHAAEGEAALPRANLRGDTYEMPGWHTEDVRYTKRAPEAAHALRAEFDGGVRKSFLRNLGAEHADTLRAAGMSDEQIARVASGRVPQGYQVHHLLPLDDGGTNEFENLVLIRNNPDHMLVTNHQNVVTRGMQPGDSRDVPWPMPDQNAGVWPDAPGAGAVQVPVEP
jgi:uncharacterized protein